MIVSFQLFMHQVPKWVGLTVFCLILSSHLQTASGQKIKPVRVGILTDCQYCNCEADGNRMYKLSLAKLDSCIGVLNSLSLDAIFHLGDMIDRDVYSFDSVIPRFQLFRPPLHLVLGNHDYMIEKKFRRGLLKRIGMQEDHYVVDLDTWRFIVLNGDDLSFFAPQDEAHEQERNDLIYNQFEHFHLNGLPWNGGIGREQMDWLKTKLEESDQLHLNVIVVCHFPLFTKDNHNLFNNKELFSLISGYACVKAYFCGHYHPGSYKMIKGIHLVNFKAMVNTEQNAFAVLTLTSDSILIKGYGREPDRKLKIRQNPEK